MYKLSPSKAHRYLQCTKSLEYDTEFVETPWTIRGSLLHEYAERLLLEKDTADFVAENEFNDYEEFLIRSYVQAVYNEYELIQADSIHIEEKEPIVLYDNKINLIIDALVLGKKTACVIDLKTGNNDISPEDNEQLLFYGYSVLLKHPKVETFRLSIFQKGKLKTTTVSREYIYDFFIAQYPVFEQIRKDELTYNPSEKACKYCAHKKNCVARAKWLLGEYNE